MKKREIVICFLAIVAVLIFFIWLPIQDKPSETFESVVYLSKAQRLFSAANEYFIDKEYLLAIGYFDQALAFIDKAESSLSVESKSSGEKTKIQKDFSRLRNTINNFKKHTEKMLQRSTPSFAL